MIMRNCPVCEAKNAEIIMRFTPQLICKLNPTYDIQTLKEAVNNKEHELTYSQCKRCGMIYCENIWDHDTLKRIYSDVIDHTKSREKIYSIAKRLALLEEWANILRILASLGYTSLQSIKLIDFGCGWGDFLDVVYGSGIEAVGYDADAVKVSFATRRGHTIAHNISQLREFAPADVLVMNSVLEHLQDIDATFNIVRDILKKDGIFVLQVMDYRKRFIQKNAKLLRNDVPALTKNLNPLEHVNIYSYGSVMTTLMRFGFEFITTGYALMLSYHFLLRNNFAFVRLFNLTERILSKIRTGKELGITAYARKIG